MKIKPGEQFHELTLLRRCGVGAYGEVWLCRDISGAHPALKLIPKSRQAVELKGVAALRSRLPAHPGILAIHHVAEDEDFLWYTMDAADNLASTLEEYQPDTLENRLKGKMAVEIFPVMHSLIAGLAALHGAGMVHRDIKPGNILFVGGRAVLGDVGMVAPETSSLSLAGTLGFIPPEVRAGTGSPGSVGKAGDVYALGMVLYCMLTGNAPEAFPSLPQDFSATPLNRRLNRLVCRVCERSPRLRLTRLDEFAEELKKIERLADRPESLRERLAARRKIVRSVLLFVSAAVLFPLSAVYFLRHGTAKTDTAGPEEESYLETKLYRNGIRPEFTMEIPAQWEILTKDAARQRMSGANGRVPKFQDAQSEKFIRDNINRWADAFQKGIEIILFDVTGKTYSDNLNIICETGEYDWLGRLGEEELRIEIKRAYTQEYRGVNPEIYNIRKIKIAGFPAFRIDMSFFPKTQHQIQYIIFAQNNKTYTITYSAHKENFARFLPAVEKAIGTIRIEEEK